MTSSQSLTNNFFDKQTLENYKNCLEEGGVFAYPTDTVWGIGCLVNNEKGAQKIYEIKKRDGQKPLILLGADMDDFAPYIQELPDTAKKLATNYWPGAITIIVKKSQKTPDFITSGFDTVGLRIPAHPVLREFLNYTKVIASTSANLSGEMASITYEQTKKSIGEKMNFILPDCGIKAKGLASTVVLVENGNCKILREGEIKIH